jgi:drug/metabolite transporter (DMT)-like permease
LKTDSLKIAVGFTAICLLWGSTWLVIKVGLGPLTPFFSAGLRFALASVFIFSLMKFKKLKLQTDPLSIKLYIILGLFSYVIPFGLVYWAEQFIESGLTSVLFAVFPFFVIIFSRIAIPGDSIGIYKLLGVTLGFTGIVIIFAENLSFDIQHDFWGSLAVFGSGAMQAGIAVTMKKYGKYLNPLSMNFVPVLIAGIILILVGFTIEDSTSWRFDLTALFSIVYLAVFGTLFTFTTYYWLLKKMNVVILSLSAFITPIVALILGWFVLGEKLSMQVLAGSSLVLIGILFANFRGLLNYYKQRTSTLKND